MKILREVLEFIQTITVEKLLIIVVVVGFITIMVVSIMNNMASIVKDLPESSHYVLPFIKYVKQKTDN